MIDKLKTDKKVKIDKNLLIDILHQLVSTNNMYCTDVPYKVLTCIKEDKDNLKELYYIINNNDLIKDINKLL
jgi:hypothetical protein